MLTTVFPCRFDNELGADHYKTQAADGWGNLLDHPALAGQGAAYQHNQTDLECLRTELGAPGLATAIGAKWEGPDFDAARMAARFNLGAKS